MSNRNLPPHLQRHKPPLKSMEMVRFDYLHDLILQAQEPDKQLYIRMYYREMGLILFDRKFLAGKAKLNLASPS